MWGMRRACHIMLTLLMITFVAMVPNTVFADTLLQSVFKMNFA